MTMFRDAGSVVRYHTKRTLQNQSVGEHSWQILRIYVEIWGPPSPAVSCLILVHDAPEVFVGDTPHPAKRRFPELRQLLRRIESIVASEMLPEMPTPTEEEIWRVCVADLIDMVEFGQDEQTLGNRGGRVIEKNAGTDLMNLLGEDADNRVVAYMRRRRQQWHNTIA